jgi:signal transduction histidine kinase
MSELNYILIYFFYGLAFFSMGLLVMIEGGRSSDTRLRRGLRPLAAFGLLHALYEWIEMFERISMHLDFSLDTPAISTMRLSLLAFSFLSLSAFGSYLLARNELAFRLSLMAPLGLVTIWIFGLFNIRNTYPLDNILNLVNVWTRYSLAIPASLLAAAGLIYQQKAFRQSGLISFGRDALWAAVAFGWYGVAGQLFGPKTNLFLSPYLNEASFLQFFGIPIQLLRAISAVTASIFVIRFLQAFQVVMDRQIADLQTAQLQEAHEREAQRGELFRQVVAAQEAERQRIARDLHDETGQALTAIGLGLRGLSTTIQHGDAQQATVTLRRLETMSANSLTELQRLIADLRPSHIDDLGLPAALRWYASEIAERSGLEVKVDISGPEQEMDESIKIVLFRIVQETLNNIIKHAQAHQVNIQLSFEMEGIRLRVRDDGQGFNPQETLRKKQGRVSLGLIGMQERANLLDGTFAITSVLGRGTQVEVKVPYTNHQKENL